MQEMGRRSRRKLGSRNYKNYTQEMLNLAVDLVRKKNITSLEAEKRFLIPRRTIENKVKGLHMKPPGAQLRLSNSEEKDIVDVLIAAADFGSPLSRLDLRILIFDYLNKNRRSSLFLDKIPGKWWVRNFLCRNKYALTERTVQNIKKARAEKTVDEFENYFNNLERTLIDVPPQNILNYDETNLSDNPGTTKCICKRKVKYPERILNHSKGNISIMFAACADGSLLPVYTVYKSEHLWSAWCLGGPPEARFNRTKSGWFDALTFEDWFKTVVIPWAIKLEGPKVIVGDNLSSHLNVGIIRLCEKHDIRFAFLPPNSTHITQPLDVAYFGPMKKIWRRILLEYKIKNPSETQINKTHFPILLKELLAKIAISNKDNIKSGFKATGIVPFNPQNVLRKLPDYEEEIKYKIDTALLDFLKKTKAPDPLKKTAANKKLKIEPGSSISSQDAEKLLDGAKTRHKTKKLNEPKNEKKRVTILADVRLLPENQAYVDITQCSSLDLKTVDAKFKLPFKKMETENINPYENPVPSTSGICKGVKRKTPNKKPIPQTKKLKFDYDSEEENEDNYSLRDTTDEETILSEDEDMALSTILKYNRKYESDYYVSETLPHIKDAELHVDVETEKDEFQEFNIDEIGTFEYEETKLPEFKCVHSKINETNTENERKNKGKKKQGVVLDNYDTEMNDNEKTQKFQNSYMDQIETIYEHRQEESVILAVKEIGKKIKIDNEVMNSSMDEIKINKNDDQNNKATDTGFDIDEIEIKKSVNSVLDKQMRNGGEETDKLQKQCMNSDTDERETRGKTYNESVKWNKDQSKINKKSDDQSKKNCTDLNFHINEIKTMVTEKADRLLNQECVKETENLDCGNNGNIDNRPKKNYIAIYSEIYENINRKSIYGNQSVLVRYYNRNNWKYYVGFIQKVDVQQTETYYSINFLRTVKKPSLKFIICKRDRDVVPSSSIVKAIKLHPVKENREYLVEECDKHYF